MKACEDLNRARQSPDTSNSFHALADALRWVVLLDSWFEKQLSGNYKNTAQPAAVAATIPGLRYARNLVEHDDDVTEVVVVEQGAKYPLRYPVVLHELKWKPFVDLPCPSKRYENPSGAKAYQTYVENKLARETLFSVQSLFQSLAALVVG